MRCDVHDLALSPDGTCVRCRRDKERKVTRRIIAGLVAVALVLVAIGVARMVLRDPAEARVDPSRAAPSVSAIVSVSPTDAEPGTVPIWYADEKKLLPEERKRVSITLYETSWCPHCRDARKWLTNQHQPFFERDVEQDTDAKKRMMTLNPRGGVPTINVDGEILVGFDPQQLDHAIDDAALRHLLAGSPTATRVDRTGR